MSEKKKRSLINPMLLLLTALFVFIVGGTAYKAFKPSQPVVQEAKDESGKIPIELDAAFGGELTGYEGIIKEADFNEKLVDALQAKLETDSHFRVLRTHEAGESKAVKEKAKKINKDKPALCITICAANSEDSEKAGMNIYPDKPQDEQAENSLAFAKVLQEVFTQDETVPVIQYQYYEPVGDKTYIIQYKDVEDVNDYGWKTWNILEKTNGVGVVVEQIYITNQSEVDTWANAQGYEALAEKYYKAIKKYFGV